MGSIADGGIFLPPEFREGGGLNAVPKKKRQENASTGASAATMRALSARLLALYFRAPMKAFLKPRVDYMGYARAINPAVQAGQSWSWRMTSPALLASAIHRQGWGFLPNHVLPPLMANTLVGAVLYTSYLQALGFFHEPSSHATKRVDPLPPPTATFAAGFVAGMIQSVIAAPLDALQIRFQANEFRDGKYRNMWQYGYRKTKEIGARGIFAGWSLSFVRDAFGNAAFFAAFEYVKGQCFYGFVSDVYGQYGRLTGFQRDVIKSQDSGVQNPVIKPHYLIEPTFILLAGMAASIAQAVIQYPIARIQDIYYDRLVWIDRHTRDKTDPGRVRAMTLYASAYRKTFKQCLAVARREGGIRRWLYHGLMMNTIRQVPSTSAGLIIFEVLRRKYADGQEAVRIEKDGYDILLV